MRGFRLGLVGVAALAVVGCAGGRAPSPGDPIEGVNRKTFAFNDGLDVYLIEPVAKGWHWALPDPFERGVANFFSNLGTPVVAANNLLQGKPLPAVSDLGRFVINTTIGLGFIDPAAEWGLVKHNEDFGQTLAVWGVPGGPYVVLPLLGPSNPRDIAGLLVDSAMSVSPFFVDGIYTIGAQVVNTVNTRAAVLEDVREIKDASVDYYSAVRNGWQQRRDAAIRDTTTATPRPNDDDLYYPDQQEKP
jgi:phospholipid-binding lipoprotein MlaA